MRKITKKCSLLFSFLLIAALALSMTACGNNNTGEGGSPNSTTAPTPTKKPTDTAGNNTDNNAANDSEAAELTPEQLAAEHNKIFDRYPAKDLGGRVIHLSSNYAFFPDTYDTELVEPDPSEEDYYSKMAEYLKIKMIMEKYNVTFDMHEEDGWNGFLGVLLADMLAGTKPSRDILLIDPQLIAAPIAQNLLLPLSEYANSYTDIMSDQQYFKPNGQWNGVEYFSLEKIIARDENGLEARDDGITMGYNRTIIESLGVEDPRALYDKGQWTYDKFLEYARLAAQKSTDERQIYGFSGALLPSLSCFVAANDGVLYDEANRKPGLDNPKTQRALELYERLWVENLYGLASGGMHDWWGNWILFNEGNVAFFEFRPWVKQEAGDNVFEIGIVPFPKGPDAGNTDYTWTRAAGGLAIVNGIDDPQTIYDIYEQMRLPYETADTIELGEGNPYAYLESVLTREEDVLMFSQASANKYKIDNYACFGDDFNGPLGNIVAPIVERTGTFAQSIEANKQILQDNINNVLNPSTE